MSTQVSGARDTSSDPTLDLRFTPGGILLVEYLKADGAHANRGRRAYIAWIEPRADVCNRGNEQGARINLRLDTEGRGLRTRSEPESAAAYGKDFAEPAEHAGVSYEQLLQRIINTGLAWRPDRQWQAGGRTSPDPSAHFDWSSRWLRHG